MVNNLDDSSQAAGLSTRLEHDDTADLDGAPLGSDNADVTHFDGGL